MKCEDCFLCINSDGHPICLVTCALLDYEYCHCPYNAQRLARLREQMPEVQEFFEAFEKVANPFVSGLRTHPDDRRRVWESFIKAKGAE